MSKRKKKNDKAKVHQALDGFNVEINEFGQIVSNFKVDKLNNFLNKEVDDKKLVDRDDLDFIQEKKASKKANGK